MRLRLWLRCCAWFTCSTILKVALDPDVKISAKNLYECDQNVSRQHLLLSTNMVADYMAHTGATDIS
ncbi:hypothetical protein AAHE18_14G163500 [Arachis hypogaea]